ncbi:MAG: hypothetical protein ABIS06_14785 [Vicinamibacterales bacterium]
MTRFVRYKKACAMKYLGTHKDGAHYQAHSMTTRSGSLWLATEDTGSTPGTGGARRLIVKRGQAS